MKYLLALFIFCSLSIAKADCRLDVLPISSEDGRHGQLLDSFYLDQLMDLGYQAEATTKPSSNNALQPEIHCWDSFAGRACQWQLKIFNPQGIVLAEADGPAVLQGFGGLDLSKAISKLPLCSQ